MTYQIPELLNQVPIYIQKADDSLTFFLANGKFVRYYHSQDCCETVFIEDIVGNLNNLLFTPMLKAEVKVSTNDKESSDSFTYTYYTYASIKGYVDVRWYGESNGYYSETVDIATGDWTADMIPTTSFAAIRKHYPEFTI